MNGSADVHQLNLLLEDVAIDEQLRKKLDNTLLRVRNNAGDSPEPRAEAIIKALIDKGANPNIENSHILEDEDFSCITS